MNNINVWRASNGEEIHGYLWQSMRLLAYDTGELRKVANVGSSLVWPHVLQTHCTQRHLSVTGTLDGHRTDWPNTQIGIGHVLKVCKPSWWLSPQSRDDCSHAAGHGYFYYFLDIGRAVTACWSDQLVLHTPGVWIRLGASHQRLIVLPPV